MDGDGDDDDDVAVDSSFSLVDFKNACLFLNDGMDDIGVKEDA